MMNCVLAVDQGTSATKCVLVDEKGLIVAKAAAPLGEHYPEPGWVEQDTEAIWDSVRTAIARCLAQRPEARVLAVGFSTQRESALVWDADTARPLTPLLSWQDQRTRALADTLSVDDARTLVRERSGLPLDPMFSALKIRWLLDRIDPGRRAARAGKLRAGTIDAWLIARLQGDDTIEVGNASRTQLLDVRRARWDDDLLQLFDIPAATLPRVAPSLARRADAAGLHPSLAGVFVHAVMADSHAALFAHGARRAGDVKATMGTGSSVMGLANVGLADMGLPDMGLANMGFAKAGHLQQDAIPHPGLCVTVAWDDGTGPQLAYEGNIRSAGATLRWVADLLGIDGETAAAEASAAETGGVCLVPAFGGLGAPYWDSNARGLVSGLTLASGRAQLLAAALDSIAHQVADVVDAMDASVPGASITPIASIASGVLGAEGVKGDPARRRLLLDGGPSRNPRLRSTLAAYIGRPVVHCTDPELSALGVAHLAGVGAGVWDAGAVLELPRAQHDTQVPDRAPADLRAARTAWAQAVARARLTFDAR